MVTLRLRFVVSDRDRHGNVRYYFRRKGEKKVRLHGFPGQRSSWTLMPWRWPA